MDTPPDGRRHTDREVRLILKNAVELQQRSSDAREPSGGLSLAELEQVAAEAGIDPAIIRRAAAALDAGGPGEGGSRFLGAGTEIVVERVVDHVLDEGDFEPLLAVVRSHTRQLGEANVVGRLFGWRGRADAAKAEVSVSPAGPRTQIRVRFELDELAFGHFMLKGMLLGGGGGLMSGAVAAGMLGPLGLLVGGVVAGGSYAWARTGFRKGAARARGRAREMASALADCLAERRTARLGGGAGIKESSHGSGAGSVQDGRYSAG